MKRMMLSALMSLSFYDACAILEEGDRRVFRAKSHARLRPKGFVAAPGDGPHDMLVGPCACGAWHP